MTLPASGLESVEHASLSEEPRQDDKKQGVAGLSPTQLAVRRFRHDKLSMIALGIATLVIIAAILAPILVKMGVLNYTSFHQNLTDPTQGGIPLHKWGGVSAHHWLGVEPSTGRDLGARLWLGLTFTMVIALSATILSVVIGTVLGIVSGYSRGFADSVIGRLVDLTLSFPQTLMLLALSVPLTIAIGNLIHNHGNLSNGLYLILVLGVFGWPSLARLIRGQVLSIREREFIDAARVLGASKSRIYFKEILPNIWAPLLVSATLMLPAYVSAEAALAFLGVGVQAPTPTLGNLMGSGVNYVTGDPWFFYVPALVLITVVVSFNLVGDGARDALDPKSDR